MNRSEMDGKIPEEFDPVRKVKECIMRLRHFATAAIMLFAGGFIGAEARAQAPIAGVSYQVPSTYAGVPPGTLVVYGGYSYVAQGDGTMLLAANQAPTPPPVATYSPGITYANPAYVPSVNYYAPVTPGWRPYPYRPFGGFGPAPLSPWDGWAPWPRARGRSVFIGR
jgi:hypothetical protein